MQLKIGYLFQCPPWARARNMLADGIDINLIMKYSGLTQEQIEKLK